MRKSIFILFLAPITILGFVSVSYAQYTVLRLTDNLSYDNDSPQVNDSGHVVWSAGGTVYLYDGTSVNPLPGSHGYRPQINNNNYVVYEAYDLGEYEIYLYDGTTSANITDNSYDNRFPQINNSGHVTYHGRDSYEYSQVDEIFLYDGTSTTQITNGHFGIHPQINEAGYLTWMGSGGYSLDILLYDGTTTTQITDDDYDDFYPQINENGHVVWEGCDGGVESGCETDWEIFLYDGVSTTQLTDNTYDDHDPRINNNDHIVWEGWDGSDFEIFQYDGTSTTQLTNNSYDDRNPKINDNDYVVWQGCLGGAGTDCYLGAQYEIFVYDGSSTRNISHQMNPYRDDVSPQISDSGHVAWKGLYGSGMTYATFLAVPCSASNDNDDDTYVSSTCGGDDCNDFDPSIHPAAPEVCANGIDEDCDGLTDCADFMDCPGTPEICTNGFDDDCDGSIDNQDSDCQPAYSAVVNAEALTYGSNSLTSSALFNELALLFIPVGAVVLLRIWRRKR